jgi:hypothetical protein
VYVPSRSLTCNSNTQSPKIPNPNPGPTLGRGEDPSPQVVDHAITTNMFAPSGEAVVWWAVTGKGTVM